MNAASQPQEKPWNLSAGGIFSEMQISHYGLLYFLWHVTIHYPPPPSPRPQPPEWRTN